MSTGLRMIHILPILAALFSTQLVLKQRIGVERDRGARVDEARALEQVFTPGEKIAASLLGGFRSILINVLWVRIQGLLEKREFLELPALFRAAEALQGNWPSIYWIEARMMMVDIPRLFGEGDRARWEWIESGVDVLRRGLRRFPDDANLAAEAGFLYFIRFRPSASAADYVRFLDGKTGANPTGRDPIDLSSEYLWKALRGGSRNPGRDAKNLWLVMIEKRDALLPIDIDIPQRELTAAERARLVAEFERAIRRRVEDPEVRRRLENLLDETSEFIRFIRDAGLARDNEAVRKWLDDCEVDVARFRQIISG